MDPQKDSNKGSKEISVKLVSELQKDGSDTRWRVARGARVGLAPPAAGSLSSVSCRAHIQHTGPQAAGNKAPAREQEWRLSAVKGGGDWPHPRLLSQVRGQAGRGTWAPMHHSHLHLQPQVTSDAFPTACRRFATGGTPRDVLVFSAEAGLLYCVLTTKERPWANGKSLSRGHLMSANPRSSLCPRSLAGESSYLPHLLDLCPLLEVTMLVDHRAVMTSTEPSV